MRSLITCTKRSDTTFASDIELTYFQYFTLPHVFRWSPGTPRTPQGLLVNYVKKCELSQGVDQESLWSPCSLPVHSLFNENWQESQLDQESLWTPCGLPVSKVRKINDQTWWDSLWTPCCQMKAN
jgi:hypothetical protein